MEPRFFASAGELRAWLAANGPTAPELLVGFHRTGLPAGGLAYAEALDEALCAGWIDGVRRRIDATSYSIRFSPRRPASRWSEVNTRRAAALISAGRMTPAGLAAFAARDPARTGEYSHEARSRPLAPAYEAELRGDRKAAAFWDGQPPSYRRAAAWWVMSARREETRRRRLAILLADSAMGQRIAALTLRPAAERAGDPVAAGRPRPKR